MKNHIRKSKIALGILALCVIIYYIFFQESYYYTSIKEKSTFDSYNEYLDRYPEGKYVDSALIWLYTFYEKDTTKRIFQYSNKAKVFITDSLYTITKKLNTISGWENYISEVPGQYLKDAYTCLYHKHDSIFTVAETENSIQLWQTYISSVSSNLLDSTRKQRIIYAKQRIEYLELQLWKTDEGAWKRALLFNSLEGYQKYLQMYPTGKHANIAIKKAIDIEVSNTFNNEHSSMPKMEQLDSNKNNPISTIYITNQTEYELTILYSGESSKKISLMPNNKRSILLANGNYRIVAYVNAVGVKRFAGREELTGGSYSVNYYIRKSYTN